MGEIGIIISQVRKETFFTLLWPSWPRTATRCDTCYGTALRHVVNLGRISVFVPTFTCQRFQTNIEIRYSSILPQKLRRNFHPRILIAKFVQSHQPVHKYNSGHTSELSTINLSRNSPFPDSINPSLFCQRLPDHSALKIEKINDL
jgi:hypothetical protein